MRLEVCVQAGPPDRTATQVLAARQGGAATVELCRDMTAGGVTPADADVRAARAALGDWPGLMVIIRPRPGDFFWSLEELAEMAAAIDRSADAGANGVVLGGLRRDDGEVDGPGMQPLVARARARGLRTTFHRAFDAAADRASALETLVSVGFDRVLTSGGTWGVPGTALEGVPTLQQTIAQAAGRIEVVIGGGVDGSNLAAIVAGVEAVPGRGHWSLHCHSAALRDGVVDRHRIEHLIRVLSSPRGL